MTARPLTHPLWPEFVERAISLGYGRHLFESDGQFLKNGGRELWLTWLYGVDRGEAGASRVRSLARSARWMLGRLLRRKGEGCCVQCGGERDGWQQMCAGCRSRHKVYQNRVRARRRES